jgi:hypothetical protein
VSDALTEAMEKAEQHLNGEAEAEAPAEVVEAAPETPAESQETQAQAEQRARDESGKFTKTPKAKAAKAKEPAAAAPKGGVHGAASAAPSAGEAPADGAAPSPAPSAEAVSTLKPPSSLRPAAKEAFSKAPREVQEDLIRIDREVRQVMQRSAEATKTAEAVHRTLAPFEGLARSQGMDSMQYAGSVLQTAAALHMGTPQQKAAVVAQIIGSYGVDLEAINAALSGQAPPAQQAQPRFDPRAEVQRALEEERVRQQEAANQATIREFLASAPEDLDEVLPQMTRLLQADRLQGGNLTPKAAYDEARWANPGIRARLQQQEQQRKAAEAARTRTAATAQAKAAAVSIRSQPAAPVSAKPKGIDAAMDAAREKLGL